MSAAKFHWLLELPKIAIVIVNAIEDVGCRSLWATFVSLGSDIWLSELSNGLLSSPYSSIECMMNTVKQNGKAKRDAWKSFQRDAEELVAFEATPTNTLSRKERSRPSKEKMD